MNRLHRVSFPVSGRSPAAFIKCSSTEFAAKCRPLAVFRDPNGEPVYVHDNDAGRPIPAGLLLVTTAVSQSDVNPRDNMWEWRGGLELLRSEVESGRLSQFPH